MSADANQVGSVTPEGVELDLPYATVGSRGIAYLLDLAIVSSLLLLFGLAESILGVGGFVPGWAGLALLLLLVFALQFGYPIGFETLWRGRTPGKAVMGLRVVTTEGAPVRFRHAAVRAVVGLIELAPTLGVPAMASSMVTRRGQRLGDLAAGTVVLRSRRTAPALTARTFAPPAGLEGYTARLDVSAVGPADYATVRDTLVRLDGLVPDARRHVAEAVAGGLLGRVSPAPPAGVPADVWLRCVAAAVQQRRPRAASPPAEAGAPPIAGGRRDEDRPPPARPRPADAAPDAGADGAGGSDARPGAADGGGFVPPA